MLCHLGLPGLSVAMAAEADGPPEHALLLRQRYAAVKHAGLGQKASGALITGTIEIVW